MRLIEDRNPWSAQVERVGVARVSPTLRAQAKRELRALQQLFALHGNVLLDLVEALVTPAMPALSAAWLPWHNLTPQAEKEIASLHARDALAVRLSEAADWTEMAEVLEQHWARHGTGPQAHYHALRWNALEQQLTGIANPDPIKLSSLVGQGPQQARLSKNIQRFLAGLPAQDMLLYGPPGTGKSSTVKALVNAYADQGLRLVEVQKEDIGDLSVVVRQLGERAPRYLVFIDDLSFEDHEMAYKALKVVLEGTAQARPANVLICATSNRLNLVRENFSDRGKPAEDVNWRDTMDEKQSLAHRFGLRVTFMSPDQRQYLSIVETLARQRGLELSGERLQELALQWERQHTGRSGRVARQFIDDLEAELKYR
jgi:predicted AAA+ superfamily ATPase